MNRSLKPLYCAALRMKSGELGGVLDLADDVAACLLPRFVVPPQGERDEKQPELLIVNNDPDISGALARHWPDRDALIDLTYLIDECGRARIADWLPQLFRRARRARARAIPLALLSDLGPTEAPAFKSAIDHDSTLKFAISVPSGEMVGPEFATALTIAIAQLGVTHRECAIIADFHDADFSVPQLVAPIITGALQTLQDFGPWQHIIFQGTNYPEKNPADHGGSEIWPRNEWNAWREAVKFDPDTASFMMFGDYAADCAKMEFSGSGGAAIPHYRYTTEDAWLVERGAKTGSHQANMRDVCTRIVGSGHFAGAGFSVADDFIFRTSRGEGPGNATTWRRVNTTHHITRVVTDIAKVRDVEIVKKIVEEPREQLSLLPEDWR